LQEAIYHGVPVLGLPFGADQISNLNKGVNHGYALKLSWSEVNEETLTETIHQLINNPK
jgi:glucuronosyltransferase